MRAYKTMHPEFGPFDHWRRRLIYWLAGKEPYVLNINFDWEKETIISPWYFARGVKFVKTYTDVQQALEDNPRLVKHVRNYPGDLIPEKMVNHVAHRLQCFREFAELFVKTVRNKE